MITPESTRIHEAGHALLLISAGCPQLQLHEIHVLPTQTAAGGCAVRSWWTEQEEGWPVWFYPGPDREADVALALFALGGLAAEIAVLGRRPSRGWYVDALAAGLRLALLGKAPRRVVRILASRLDETHDDETSEALIRRVRQVTATHSSLDFAIAFKALEEEAVRRATASIPALKAIADALADRQRLPAAEVLQILDSTTWCGVSGVPQIPGIPL